MSTIIQKVSYQKEDAKQLTEKLGELLGIHRLEITLRGSELISGIISEVGVDYIILIDGDFDTIVPISNILCFRYQH
jgi:hypothetical protein